MKLNLTKSVLLRRTLHLTNNKIHNFHYKFERIGNTSFLHAIILITQQHYLNTQECRDPNSQKTLSQNVKILQS